MRRRLGWVVLFLAGCGGGAGGGGNDAPPAADAAVVQQPSGESHWLKVFMGPDLLCGLHSLDGLRCRPLEVAAFGADLAAVGVPDDLATGVDDMALTEGGGCAILADGGTLRCFGDLRAPDREPNYRAVTAGPHHACALSVEGKAECFADAFGGDGRIEAPDERFVQLAAGDRFTCGLRAEEGADGRWVTCWGEVPWSDASWSQLPFEGLTVGRGFACASAVSDQITECHGADGRGQVSEAPSEGFRFMVAGSDFACGQDLEGRLACWGAPIDAPAGDVLKVAAAGEWLCAVTANDASTIECAQVPEAGRCVPGPELPNAVDDDCDGAVDEDLDCQDEVIGFAATQVHGDDGAELTVLELPTGEVGVAWLARGGRVDVPVEVAPSRDELVWSVRGDDGQWRHSTVWAEEFDAEGIADEQHRNYQGLTNQAATLDDLGRPAFFVCRGNPGPGFRSTECRFLLTNAQLEAVPLGDWRPMAALFDGGQVHEPIRPRLTWDPSAAALVATARGSAWNDIEHPMMLMRAWPEGERVEGPRRIYRRAYPDDPDTYTYDHAGVVSTPAGVFAAVHDRLTDEAAFFPLSGLAEGETPRPQVVQVGQTPPETGVRVRDVAATLLADAEGPRLFLHGTELLDPSIHEFRMRDDRWERTTHPWPIEAFTKQSLAIGAVDGRAVFWGLSRDQQGDDLVLSRWVEGATTPRRVAQAVLFEGFPLSTLYTGVSTGRLVVWPEQLTPGHPGRFAGGQLRAVWCGPQLDGG